MTRIEAVYRGRPSYGVSSRDGTPCCLGLATAVTPRVSRPRRNLRTLEAESSAWQWHGSLSLAAYRLRWTWGGANGPPPGAAITPLRMGAFEGAVAGFLGVERCSNGGDELLFHSVSGANYSRRVLGVSRLGPAESC